MDYSKLPKLSQSPPPPDNSADSAESKPTSFCTQCGVPLVAGSKFCGGCGAAAQGATIAPVYGNQAGSPAQGMDAVFGLVAGIVMVFLGWAYAQYLSAKLSGRPFETGWLWEDGPKMGQMREYYELKGGTAYTDGGMFWLGVSLLLQALILLAAARAGRAGRVLIAAGMALLTVAALYNGFAITKVMGMGYSPPILSILAEIYAIFALGQQIFALTRARNSHSTT